MGVNGNEVTCCILNFSRKNVRTLQIEVRAWENSHITWPPFPLSGLTGPGLTSTNGSTPTACVVALHKAWPWALVALLVESKKKKTTPQGGRWKFYALAQRKLNFFFYILQLCRERYEFIVRGLVTLSSCARVPVQTISWQSLNVHPTPTPTLTLRPLSLPFPLQDS